MASPDIAPQVINSFYEVSSVFLGKGLVASFKSSLTSGRIQHGDFVMSRSRNLLQQYLRVLPLEEQKFIRRKFDEAKVAKEKVERDNITLLQKFIFAMDYEKIAEYTFKVIERASNRAIDDGLMAQISSAIGEEAGPQPPPTGPLPTGPHPPPTGPLLPSVRPQPPTVGPSTLYRNPFTSLSTSTDVNVHDLELVKMEAYRSRVTGEAAVVLDLHRRDASRQQVFTTFSPQALLGNVSHDLGDMASLSSYDRYGPPSEDGDNADR